MATREEAVAKIYEVLTTDPEMSEERYAALSARLKDLEG